MTKTYEVQPSFNLADFLSGSRTAGIKLEKADASEAVDGCIILSGGRLSVAAEAISSGQWDTITALVVAQGGAAE